MKRRHQNLLAILMMCLASLWIIASPTLVFSLSSIRGTFEQSGWGLTHAHTGLDCIFHFEWTDRVAVSWLAAFLLIGVVGVFAGLALFLRRNNNRVQDQRSSH